MRSDGLRWIPSLAAVVAFAALVLVVACGEQAPAPAGPEAQAPSFYHGDGDGEADATKTISGNISGDGSEVCNDSQVKDSEVVGDEGTWFGEKVDPPRNAQDNGFSLDVSNDKTHLSWVDEGPNLMEAVLIKAGGSSVVYYYNEGDPDAQPDPVEEFSDDGLDGDDGKEISHFVYCFVEQPAAKRGVKFEDTDADGERDDGEPGLAGWEIQVYADDDEDGVLDDSELDAGPVAATTTADGSGRLDEGGYEFRLDPGAYVVCEVQQDGWHQSLPSGEACAVGDGLGDGGYGVRLEAAEMDEGNDFGNNRAAIEVTVEDQDGNPVEGQSVIAVHSQNGPYRDDGSLRIGKTDGSGVTLIGGVEAGSYCVHASPIAPTSELLVPPTDPDEAPALQGEPGTVVTPTPDDHGNAPLTLSNFEDACVGSGASASIEPGDQVTVTLQTPGDDVEGSFEDFEGALGEISAWMVADLSTLPLPQDWLDNVPETEVADRRLGLLVTGADDEGTPGFTIEEAPGGNVVVESDKVSVGDGFASASLFTDGTGDVGTVAVEPLRCVTQTVAEPSDDGGTVELIGPYDHGFLADKNLELIEDAFGISYAQTAGEAKLKVRAKTKNTKRLVVDYECDADGNCTLDKTRGGLAKRVDVNLGSAGGNRVRWMITGLPNGTQKVQSGVSAPNDQIPNTAKDDSDDGLVDAELPSGCVNGQPTWTIGG